MCAVFCYCLFSEVLRDNSCVYVAHVCFYVCCSDSAGVCRDVCGVDVSVWEGCWFRHADVVCSCHVCIPCKLLELRSA